jgi:hypothetical protein
MFGGCKCKGKGHCSPIVTKGGDLGLYKWQEPFTKTPMFSMVKYEDGEWSTLREGSLGFSGRWEVVPGFHGNVEKIVVPGDAGGDPCNPTVALKYATNLPKSKKMKIPPASMPEEVETYPQLEKCPIPDEGASCGFSKGISAALSTCFPRVFDPTDSNTPEFACDGECVESATAFGLGPVMGCKCTTGTHKTVNCANLYEGRQMLGLKGFQVHGIHGREQVDGPYKVDVQTGKFCIGKKKKGMFMGGIGKKNEDTYEWVYAGDAASFPTKKMKDTYDWIEPTPAFMPLDEEGHFQQAACDLSALVGWAKMR